jgi:hypothetical protein
MLKWTRFLDIYYSKENRFDKPNYFFFTHVFPVCDVLLKSLGLLCIETIGCCHRKGPVPAWKGFIQNGPRERTVYL